MIRARIYRTATAAVCGECKGTGKESTETPTECPFCGGPVTPESARCERCGEPL